MLLYEPNAVLVIRSQSHFFYQCWFTENVQVKPKFNTQYHPRNPPSPTKNLKPWTPFNPDATLWVSGWKAREEVERKELKMVLNELKTVIFYFMTTAGRQSCWHVNCLSQPFVSIFKKNATVNSQESKKTKYNLVGDRIVIFFLKSIWLNLICWPHMTSLI